jgi:hypothetical protein
MAAADATNQAIRDQAFRLYWRIVSTATGNPLSGGLTGLAATISKDGGNFAATTNAPVEIQTSGYGYLDFTADEMDAYSALAQITASNTGAVAVSENIVPLQLDQFAGRWDSQSVLRFEQLVLQLSVMLGLNGITQTGAALIYLNPDGSEALHGTVYQNNLAGGKGRLS